MADGRWVHFIRSNARNFHNRYNRNSILYEKLDLLVTNWLLQNRDKKRKSKLIVDVILCDEIIDYYLRDMSKTEFLDIIQNPSVKRTFSESVDIHSEEKRDFASRSLKKSRPISIKSSIISPGRTKKTSTIFQPKTSTSSLVSGITSTTGIYSNQHTLNSSFTSGLSREEICAMTDRKLGEIVSKYGSQTDPNILSEIQYRSETKGQRLTPCQIAALSDDRLVEMISEQGTSVDLRIINELNYRESFQSQQSANSNSGVEDNDEGVFVDIDQNYEINAIKETLSKDVISEQLKTLSNDQLSCLAGQRDPEIIEDVLVEMCRRKNLSEKNYGNKILQKDEIDRSFMKINYINTLPSFYESNPDYDRSQVKAERYLSVKECDPETEGNFEKFVKEDYSRNLISMPKTMNEMDEELLKSYVDHGIDNNIENINQKPVKTYDYVELNGPETEENLERLQKCNSLNEMNMMNRCHSSVNFKSDNKSVIIDRSYSEGNIPDKSSHSENVKSTNFRSKSEDLSYRPSKVRVKSFHDKSSVSSKKRSHSDGQLNRKSSQASSRSRSKNSTQTKYSDDSTNRQVATRSHIEDLCDKLTYRTLSEGDISREFNKIQDKYSKSHEDDEHCTKKSIDFNGSRNQFGYMSTDNRISSRCSSQQDFKSHTMSRKSNLNETPLGSRDICSKYGGMSGFGNIGDEIRRSRSTERRSPSIENSSRASQISRRSTAPSHSHKSQKSKISTVRTSQTSERLIQDYTSLRSSTRPFSKTSVIRDIASKLSTQYDSKTLDDYESRFSSSREKNSSKTYSSVVRRAENISRPSTKYEPRTGNEFNSGYSSVRPSANTTFGSTNRKLRSQSPNSKSSASTRDFEKCTTNTKSKGSSRPNSSRSLRQIMDYRTQSLAPYDPMTGMRSRSQSPSQVSDPVRRAKEYDAYRKSRERENRSRSASSKRNATKCESLKNEFSKSPISINRSKQSTQYEPRTAYDADSKYTTFQSRQPNARSTSGSRYSTCPSTKSSQSNRFVNRSGQSTQYDPRTEIGSRFTTSTRPSTVRKVNIRSCSSSSSPPSRKHCKSRVSALPSSFSHADQKYCNSRISAMPASQASLFNRIESLSRPFSQCEQRTSEDYEKRYPSQLYPPFYTPRNVECQRPCPSNLEIRCGKSLVGRDCAPMHGKVPSQQSIKKPLREIMDYRTQPLAPYDPRTGMRSGSTSPSSVKRGKEYDEARKVYLGQKSSSTPSECNNRSRKSTQYEPRTCYDVDSHYTTPMKSSEYLSKEASYRSRSPCLRSRSSHQSSTSSSEQRFRSGPSTDYEPRTCYDVESRYVSSVTNPSYQSYKSSTNRSPVGLSQTVSTPFEISNVRCTQRSNDCISRSDFNQSSNFSFNDKFTRPPTGRSTCLEKSNLDHPENIKVSISRRSSYDRASASTNRPGSRQTCVTTMKSEDCPTRRISVVETEYIINSSESPSSDDFNTRKAEPCRVSKIQGFCDDSKEFNPCLELKKLRCSKICRQSQDFFKLDPLEISSKDHLRQSVAQQCLEEAKAPDPCSSLHVTRSKYSYPCTSTSKDECFQGRKTLGPYNYFERMINSSRDPCRTSNIDDCYEDGATQDPCEIIDSIWSRISGKEESCEKSLSPCEQLRRSSSSSRVPRRISIVEECCDPCEQLKRSSSSSRNPCTVSIVEECCEKSLSPCEQLRRSSSDSRVPRRISIVEECCDPCDQVKRSSSSSRISIIEEFCEKALDPCEELLRLSTGSRSPCRKSRVVECCDEALDPCEELLRSRSSSRYPCEISHEENCCDKSLSPCEQLRRSSSGSRVSRRVSVVKECFDPCEQVKRSSSNSGTPCRVSVVEDCCEKSLSPCEQLRRSRSSSRTSRRVSVVKEFYEKALDPSEELLRTSSSSRNTCRKSFVVDCDEDPREKLFRTSLRDPCIATIVENCCDEALDPCEELLQSSSSSSSPCKVSKAAQCYDYLQSREFSQNFRRNNSYERYPTCLARDFCEQFRASENCQDSILNPCREPCAIDFCEQFSAPCSREEQRRKSRSSSRETCVKIKFRDFCDQFQSSILCNEPSRSKLNDRCSKVMTRDFCDQCIASDPCEKVNIEVTCKELKTRDFCDQFSVCKENKSPDPCEKVVKRICMEPCRDKVCTQTTNVCFDRDESKMCNNKGVLTRLDVKNFPSDTDHVTNIFCNYPEKEVIVIQNKMPNDYDYDKFVRKTNCLTSKALNFCKDNCQSCDQCYQEVQPLFQKKNCMIKTLSDVNCPQNQYLFQECKRRPCELERTDKMYFDSGSSINDVIKQSDLLFPNSCCNNDVNYTCPYRYKKQSRDNCCINSQSSAFACSPCPVRARSPCPRRRVYDDEQSTLCIRNYVTTYFKDFNDNLQDVYCNRNNNKEAPLVVENIDNNQHNNRDGGNLEISPSRVICSECRNLCKCCQKKISFAVNMAIRERRETDLRKAI